MKIIKGDINAPKGFKATGDHVGIKKYKKDLALIFTKNPAVVAGTFTTNVVKAAPVLWDENIVKENKRVRAIVANSGVANACTGEEGIIRNEKMAEKTAQCFNVSKNEVLVCSTGVIGVQLPIEKICSGIEKTYTKIGDDENSANLAAEAILTTDTFTKQISVEFKCGGKTVKIGGMAKGSGMIHPNMATMLSFITTDANISKELLQMTLGYSIEESYNMISVDGDTSTNDTVLVMANGMAENEEIKNNTKDYEIFKEAFDYVNKYLAKEIVRDGEGASKFIEAWVKGAKTKEDAKIIAKSIITSNLVKTAFFGEDANWGRVLCAMGYSGVNFNTNKVVLKFKSNAGEVKVLENGMPIIFDEEYALRILKEKEIQIIAELSDGNSSAKAWGCDLSYEYVKINGEYRT